MHDPVTRAEAAGQICQVAMCTSDIPGSVRFYTEAFGFASAGGRPLWGRRLGQIQRLPTGDRSTCTVWWLVGRQDFVQLELFTHTAPPQRPIEPDRTSADPRYGILVPDFGATIDRLARLGVVPASSPESEDGPRRACVREPGADVVVEIIEAGSTFAGRAIDKHFDLSPAIGYVALSVASLDQARRPSPACSAWPSFLRTRCMRRLATQ